MTARLLALPLALCVLALVPAIAEAESRVAGDFNGDGHDDLAVGVPGDNASELRPPAGVSNAGAVNVIYGSQSRLTADGDQLWHQDSPGIAGEAEFFDTFGSSLAAGDFNGDGFDDLAVGVPGDSVGGAVNVIYGSAGGLTADGNQLWSQDSAGIDNAAQFNDRFGSSLTAGDFDGSGHDDLAVGVRFEDVAGSLRSAGAVNVIYGSASGLTANGSQFWHQNVGTADAAESGDFFGSSLAAGDFQGDGHDDLAVGVPREDVGSVVSAGAVDVLYGAAGGLTANGNQLWHQDSAGIADAAENFEEFGISLATGDFNGSGHDDLAVGVPDEDVGSLSGAGAVNVLYGAGVGLRERGNQLWHQDSAGIVGSSGGDGFGSSLTVGDFNGSGHDDLAVGVPFERIGSIGSAGAVNVLYGAGVGLRDRGNQLWHQDSAGIADAAAAGDGFGSSLTAADLNGSGHDDLAVGVPGEFERGAPADDAGAVNVIYGAGVGLRTNDNQFWHLNSPGIVGTPQDGDRFGAALPT